MGIKKRNFLFILYAAALAAVLTMLTGCASSDVSRNSASEVDNVYDSASKVGDGMDPIGSYQNASQKVKGGIIGAAAGAVVGTVSSPIGVVTGTVGGAIFGAAIGAYLDQHSDWRDKLDNVGGQVIVLGDQVKIILPSSALFHSMTAEINHSAYSTLDLVADYLRSLTTESVKIAAYTNATGPSSVDQEISQEQASAVARYLWSVGVNTRVMTAVGYGGTHLVTKNTTDWNTGENYRVEITVEKL